MIFCAPARYNMEHESTRAREHVRNFVILAVVFVAACGGAADTPTNASEYQDLPADQIVVGMEQYVTVAGKQRAILRGDTAYVFDDSMKAHVKNVNLALFDELGRESAQLTSREGEFSNVSQAMIARGNVVLVTRGADPRTIETEELHYDPNTKRIWSDKATRMRSAAGVVNGSGFRADEDFDNVQITNARGSGSGLRF